MSRTIPVYSEEYIRQLSHTLWSLGYSINRANGYPRFSDEVFTKLTSSGNGDSLEEYLANNADKVYDGQVFRVVNTSDYSVAFYYAKYNGTSDKWEYSELANGAGSGSFDPTNYYTQTQVNALLANRLPKRKLVTDPAEWLITNTGSQFGTFIPSSYPGDTGQGAKPCTISLYNGLEDNSFYLLHLDFNNYKINGSSMDEMLFDDGSSYGQVPTVGAVQAAGNEFNCPGNIVLNTKAVLGGDSDEYGIDNTVVFVHVEWDETTYRYNKFSCHTACYKENNSIGYDYACHIPLFINEYDTANQKINLWYEFHHGMVTSFAISDEEPLTKKLIEIAQMPTSTDVDRAKKAEKAAKFQLLI